MTAILRTMSLRGVPHIRTTSEDESLCGPLLTEVGYSIPENSENASLPNHPLAFRVGAAVTYVCYWYA